MKRRSRSSRKATSNTASFKKNVGEIARFAEPSFGLLRGVNFSEAGETGDSISKKALVLVEGSHTDNNGRKHNFSSDDIEWFAEATNEFLEAGGRVPWQSDHDKTQKSNIGDLEDYLVTKVITPDDLPSPKLAKNLVGKLGLFATELVGKGKDVVEQIRAGRIKTLSPGIDIKTGIIREISATPTPAIVGMSIFSMGSGKGSNAINWEQAESCQMIDEQSREEYDYLTDTLWGILTHILNATEEEAPLNDRDGMVDEALQGFAERLMGLLGIDSEEGYLGAGISEADEMQNHQATQKLSLSSNLSELANFGLLPTGKHHMLKKRIGGFEGAIGTGKIKNGKKETRYVAVGGSVTRKRKSSRKKRR